MSNPLPRAQLRGRTTLLLVSVFVVASCGIIYELIAGALSSYLIGSSVTQFSIVIGLFMFAMGIGSFLSRYVNQDPLTTFVVVEVALGVIGGCAPLLLFFAFTYLEWYHPYLVISSLLIGTLIGLEIPLVIRILRSYQALPNAISSVLALDYIGALAASLLFPLVLVPHLGLVRTGFVFGLLNIVVAAIALWKMADDIRLAPQLKVASVLCAALLTTGIFTAGGLTSMAEDKLYQDEILLARDTPYQRIVVTRWRDDIRLYLDGHLQFSSVDEARYHEPLVHVAMSAVPLARRVLVLGGGDGMAVREILKYENVESIDLVDLDAEVTRLFSERDMLRALNKGALLDPRVHVHHLDAGKFLEQSDSTWDVAIVDLPDPSSPALARLYARSFYRLLGKRLSPRGVFVTQATSPFYSPEAFWCVLKTVEASTEPSFFAYPYHVNVPSFGEWGFVLGSRQAIDVTQSKLIVPTRFLTQAYLSSLFLFPADLSPRDVDVNRLDRAVIVRYYERGWRSYSN